MEVDIKKYECVTCAKNFICKGEMMIHYESKSHIIKCINESKLNRLKKKPSINK